MFITQTLLDIKVVTKLTDWKQVWSKWPCSNCKKRWPNEHIPEAEVGDGCDGPGCEERPDLEYLYEPMEAY